MPNSYPKKSAKINNGRVKIGDSVMMAGSAPGLADTVKVTDILQSGRNKATIITDKALCDRHGTHRKLFQADQLDKAPRPLRPREELRTAKVKNGRVKVGDAVKYPTSAMTAKVTKITRGGGGKPPWINLDRKITYAVDGGYVSTALFRAYELEKVKEGDGNEEAIDR